MAYETEEAIFQTYNKQELALSTKADLGVIFMYLRCHLWREAAKTAISTFLRQLYSLSNIPQVITRFQQRIIVEYGTALWDNLTRQSKEKHHI